MLHPIKGTKKSPHYYNVVLLNYARLRGYSFGCKGYAGVALYVEYIKPGWLCFKIEGRGAGCSYTPSVPPFPFNDRISRRSAFRSVMKEFLFRQQPVQGGKGAA